MRCPKCQFDNPDNMQFCGRCGSKLASICPKCEFVNPPGFQFCGKCGAGLLETTSAPSEDTVPRLEELHARLQKTMPSSLAAQVQTDTGDAEGENRILTVLFADVSGSVAVTENMTPEDAADLISECLKAMVDTILKYGGTINRFLGDSVLAFFGVPETHENDPERAILAALEMREAVTRLNLSISIGINTGMVYVGGIGPDSHREFAAMGTAVNLAARLEKEAEPGQILVGEATYRHTRRSFRFRQLEPMTIRGISEPVTAYEALEALPRGEKIRGIEGLRAEMIGREKEFTQLKECVDELLQGRGQIISVIGEAGVGKSRLVSELKGYIADKDVTWLEGRCVSIGESIGYWVFTDMLKSYLEFAEDDTPEALREKIVSSMQFLFPQRWEEVVPYVGNLLSVRFGNQWDDRIKYLPAEQVKYQTFLTLRDIFHTLSQQKPLLLILEDMHWSDNLSLDLLNLMMDDLSLAPMLLLCVYRPYREHRSWHISSQASAKCLDRYTELTLRGLTEHESRRLVQSLLRIENLPDTIRESILQKAEGNPFFVEEVIRSLIESDVIYKDGTKWFARDEVSDITVPDTIQSVIMSRIDRLEDEVRYVLQSAAVIGRLFRHRLLHYTTQQEQNLDRYLWQLEDRDLVYEERAIPELEYSFRHVLTQETAYNTILSRRRREFHRKVAEGYEALYSSRIEEYYEELAYHYSRSDDRQKALDYLVKAGDKSREAFANEEAIEYYTQVLRLMDDSETDAASDSTIGHIYQSLGEIYFSLMKHDEGLECCSKALEYATDKKQRARIYGMMGRIYERSMQRGFIDDALEHLNQGIAELGDDTECPEMAWICSVLATVYLWRDHEKAMDAALRGLQIVEGTGHYFETVELYSSLVLLCGRFGGDLDKAFDYGQKSLEIARESGSSYLIAQSMVRLGLTYHIHNGESDDDIAIKLVREAAENFSKIGYKFGIGLSCMILSDIYDRRGNLNTAIEYAEHALANVGPSHYYIGTPYLACLYLQQGDAQKAMEYARETLELSIHSFYVASALGVIERVFLAEEKHDEFIPYFMKLRQECEKASQSGLDQWYLEPKEPSSLFSETVFMDDFHNSEFSSEWEWIDPSGDSSYSFSREASWLEMQAAAGSEFLDCFVKYNAPRLVQEISGDFAIETKLKAASHDLLSIGGILVWQDSDRSYIRFDRGIRHPDEIRLSTGRCFGRGMLVSDITYLRLERTGDRFSSYCSSDGTKWFTCGEVDFPAEDPIKVGIQVTGSLILAGLTFSAGVKTATRFDYFRILRKKS